ncbi:MAG TPA: CHAT domain-containing protein [Thermoanaerobaculia bacterium]|jgi:CHAT domain-containing protein/tetratricopeptide (TPR) repeat protein|nr:CHAT domain-containing protein [Thermoanaerobaculia bacterium]
MRGGAIFLMCVASVQFLGASRLLSQGPGPFEFREEFLLEHRLRSQHLGEDYSPSRVAAALSFEGPSLTRPFLPNRDDPGIYGTARWWELLQQTDTYRRMGGFEVAESQYLAMLEGVSKVQGATSGDAALLLDHIGEFYLEARDTKKGYDLLVQAVQARRRWLERLPKPAGAELPSTAVEDAENRARLHLSDLLTRLGQLDLAKADLMTRLDQLDLAKEELERAGTKLKEAVAIGAEPGWLRYVNGLYAIYFRSRGLEKQGNWGEAESLWADALRQRENMFLSDPYWNALKEQAAFYARWGKFHQATAIAQKVLAGTEGKLMKLELPMPYPESRPRAADPSNDYEQRRSGFRLTSDIAMSEILALDRWSTDGPAAAAPLLKDPTPDALVLEHGAVSDRYQLLDWLGQRVFLHLSILLDGEPTQEHVNEAYRLLCNVKGRFLGTEESTNRRLATGGQGLEDDRKLPLLKELAKTRERHTRLFIASVAHERTVLPEELATIENRERMLSEAISSGVSAMPSYFSLDAFRDALPTDTAVVDFVRWRRTDRQSLTLLPPEYGAFIVRNGQHLVYVRLAPAEQIDTDIKATGKGTEGAMKALRRLHEGLIAPLESALGQRGSSPAVTRLLIVPYGRLATAPFAAFLDGAGRYLLTRYTISYLGSWRDLRGVAPQETATSRPLVVAAPDFMLSLGGPATAAPVPRLNPFDFASETKLKTEAETVRNALRLPAARVLTGKAAREETLRSIASPEILHFATHSLMDTETPTSAWGLFEFPQPAEVVNPFLRSVIALSGASRTQAGEEDGLLTGLEIQSLRLAGTKLVVLSSCSSGSGKETDGQGILGLRSAFALAGADALVTTLWPVYDESSQKFMEYFYAHLGATTGPAEALRLAQLDLMTKTGYKEPFYWAGYQCASHPQAAGADLAARARETAPKGPLTITPLCFELKGHRKEGAETIVDSLRIQLGSQAHALWRSAKSAFYDKIPGSRAEQVSRKSSTGERLPSYAELTGEPVAMNVQVRIERKLEQSELFFQWGRIIVSFEGPPDLFPSVDVPSSLPSLSFFTKAEMFVGRSFDKEKIDEIAPCTAAPPGQ